jgi:signal transduction histidine kinase
MQELHHSVPMGVGIIGAAAATGQSVLRPNVVEDSDWQPNSLLPRTKGELAVPIKLDEQVMGVLDVQSERVDALGANDQLLLEGLCGQIAVAIESTRLQQEMETNLRELTALQRYMIREGWDTYEERLQTPGYQFDQGGIHELTPEKLPVIEQDGRSPAEDNGQVVTNTPLQIRGETIGTIGVIDEDADSLDPVEQDFLQSVAEQVAEALEVARLFEQTQRSLSEQERLTGELETVAQLSTVASTILEVEALLQQVTDLAKRSFDLYHAHIFLLDEYEERLVLQAGAGNVGRLMTLEGHEIGLHADAIVARAARTREPVIENDVRKSLDFLPNPFLPNTQSEMAAPLIVADNVIGVIDLQAEEQDRFSEDDVRIHKTLASQIAVAIENARLYARQVETASKLREVDQLKSEFLASMSHELRTPLNSIIGFADVLLEGLDGELNERMEEDVRLIRDSGKHLRSLIGDILDMSKIEAGRMELRYEEVDMEQMAKDVAATAQPLVNEKGLKLFTEIGDDVGVIEADRTRIRQVLWNIMGNAIKFTEEGSVTLTMEMEDPNNLLISIRDTGIGIAPENRDIVFEQFRQVDGKLNRKAGGTGLGMPISKQLVELHGGQIGVESTVGEGSTFWFILPRTRRHAARPKTGPLSPPSA